MFKKNKSKNPVVCNVLVLFGGGGNVVTRVTRVSDNSERERGKEKKE